MLFASGKLLLMLIIANYSRFRDELVYGLWDGNNIKRCPESPSNSAGLLLVRSAMPVKEFGVNNTASHGIP